MEYWQQIDSEFGMASELYQHLYKGSGKDQSSEKILQDWLQELSDWRTDNGLAPVQDVNKDIADLRGLLSMKAENELLSEEATADSCYYNRLLLLSLGTSELQRDPKLKFENEADIDQEDVLAVSVNESKRNSFYNRARQYLSGKDEYNHNKGKNRDSLHTNELDGRALEVLNKLGVLEPFYAKRHYYHFKTLPAFVADELIARGQQSELYYYLVFPKFESLSNIVAKDIFNHGSDKVIGTLFKSFERFPETDPLWVLEKVLKCITFTSHVNFVGFINKYIDNPADIKKAYQLVLKQGIKIEDESISDKLSVAEREEYRAQRDQYISDITAVLGDDDDHRNHEKIKNLEKFYEMADNGFGPVLLERVGNNFPDFDKQIMMEKLQKNKQSAYCLHYYQLQEAVPAESLVDNIIEEGDVDVLAASLVNVEAVKSNESNIIKLWDNGYQWAVKNNIKSLSNLSDKLLQVLLDDNEVKLIFANLHRFKLSSESFRSLIDNHEEKFINIEVSLKYIEDAGEFKYFFEKINDVETLKKLMKTGFLGLSKENQNVFVEAVSKTAAFEDFLAYALENDCLSDLDFQISAVDLDKAIEVNGDGERITILIDSLKNKPKDSFYVQNEDLLKGVSHSSVISFYIQLQHLGVLSRRREDLNLCLQASNDLALQILQRNEVSLLANNLDKFSDLDEGIATKLVEQNMLPPLVNNIDKFNNLGRELGLKLMSSLEVFPDIVKVNDYYNPPLDKMVAKASDIFGAYVSAENYKIIKGINNEDKEVIKKLHLKKGGNDGLRELQERLSIFKKEIISEDFRPEFLLQEDNAALYSAYFQSYIRYAEARWGKKDEANFKKVIETYLNEKSKGELKKLNPKFTPSPELYIAKADTGARENHQFNEHFLNRFAVLINSIKTAKNLSKESFPLDKLVEQIELKRVELISALSNKADSMPNPQAREGLSRKIRLLESVNMRSIKDFQSNFSILAANKEFNELLRQAVFLISFSKNKQSQDYDLNSIDLKKPSIDDISWTLDFVDHITNQETLSKYFTDKKAQKMFNDVISVQAISDEMALLQDAGGPSRDTTKLQLMPTRGILTEFSGHIADACWASQYQSIAKEFPNFTPVIIRQNPETKFERLAGALMLIETESSAGERLLVIRGFNPIENLINSLSVEDFYEQVTGYLKDLAEKDQRKLVIVVDDSSGGSASNRPVLFNYLSKEAETMKAVDLKSTVDTSFNGYDIVRKTYFVR